METLDYRNQNISKDCFVELINKTRKAKKGEWYVFVGNVEGKEVALKGFGTWLQRFTIDGIHQLAPMDQSVAEFKSTLFDPFN